MKRFPSKMLATRRDVLENLLGEEGGAVKIQMGNGVLEEERRYPRAGDSHRSSLVIFDGDGRDVVLPDGLAPLVHAGGG